jgi:hypothetical protein
VTLLLHNGSLASRQIICTFKLVRRICKTYLKKPNPFSNIVESHSPPSGSLFLLMVKQNHYNSNFKRTSAFHKISKKTLISWCPPVTSHSRLPLQTHCSYELLSFHYHFIPSDKLLLPHSPRLLFCGRDFCCMFRGNNEESLYRLRNNSRLSTPSPCSGISLGSLILLSYLAICYNEKERGIHVAVQKNSY